ncbi:MAG: hypothetical protein Q4E24_12255 [bacterium]|nr:hypothetical protein [bacterium]
MEEFKKLEKNLEQNLENKNQVTENARGAIMGKRKFVVCGWQRCILFLHAMLW